MLSSLSSTMRTVFFIVCPGARFLGLHAPVHPKDDDSTREPLDEKQTRKSMASYRKITVEEAESVALSAFMHLAQDDERLTRFLDMTGLRPDTVREAAATPGFFAAVLDHV